MLVLQNEERLSEWMKAWRIRIAGGKPSLARGDSESIQGFMLIDSRLREVLDVIGRQWGSPENVVTASLLMKGYSLPLFALQCISFSDATPLLDFSRFSIRVLDNKGMEFDFRDWRCSYREADDREEWRARQVAGIFRDHVALLIRRLHEASRIPQETLWAHVAYSVDYFYRKWIEETPGGRLQDIIRRDYVFLTREAPAELFGWHKNPLRVCFRETDIPGQPGKTIRVRDKCCLFYCLPGNVPCYTCPRLSDGERVHRWRMHQKERH